MKISRTFAYLFATVAFAAGTSVGLLRGSLDQDRLIQAGQEALEASFYQGVFAMCGAVFYDTGLCNEAVATAKEKQVYGDPYWVEGYEPIGVDADLGQGG